ncbi:MAG: TraR/DksA family transcriptional regulator [Acidimicrobiales bacterium]
MSSDAPAADYKVLLDDERTALLAKLSELGYGEGGRLNDGGSMSYDSNFADTSQVTAERGEADALAQSLREALSEVEGALANLESGRYGRCRSCGNQIAPARLEAMPMATLCINCASHARR